MNALTTTAAESLRQIISNARQTYADLLSRADDPNPEDGGTLCTVLASLDLTFGTFEADVRALAEVPQLESQITPREELERLAAVTTEAREKNENEAQRIVSEIVKRQQEIQGMAFEPGTGRFLSMTPEQMERALTLKREAHQLELERPVRMATLAEAFTEAYAASETAKNRTREAQARISEVRAKHPTAFGTWPQIDVSALPAGRLMACLMFERESVAGSWNDVTS